MKSQVRASGWVVMTFRCHIVLGDIILESSDYVCMVVVVGWFTCLQSLSWRQDVVFHLSKPSWLLDRLLLVMTSLW
jgi:hypothetical protein